MTVWIKQSTTQHALRFFLVQSSDHITGLTGATPTVKIGKAGGTGAAPSGAVTEIDSTNLPGWYKIAANATDTNTLGSIDIHATATSADPCDVMDAAFVVPMDPTSATAFITSVATVTTVTNQLTAAQIATGVWQDATGGDFTTASSIGKSLYTSGVVPGGSGGILISGSNSGTTTLGALTVTGATTHTGNVSMAAGLNITQSSSNTSALVVTGNGTGHGAILTSGSGATGDGFKVVSAATNGNGMTFVHAGTGKDLNATTYALTIPGDTWDVTLASHVTAGSTGFALNAAGAAGDPWSTSIPGAYAAGSAGYIVGTILNATDSGTAQSVTGTTLVMKSAAAFADSELVGQTLHILAATTGAGQSRLITANVGSTDTLTVDAWTTTPTGTITYAIYPSAPGSATSPAPSNLTQILGTAVSTPATAGILDVNVKNINNVTAATPGASGGLLISGSNAGTTTFGALTVTGATTHTGNVSMAAGLNITQSSSNTDALVVTGNGTGAGATFTSGSGATGNGINATSTATNGHGLVTTGKGTGNGLRIASISGDALLTTVSTSGHGATFAGTGTTKHGVNATGGTTTSHGISATGGGVGHGILATSGGGATGDGIAAVAASTNGNGMTLTHAGTGKDLNATTTPLAVASVVGAVGSIASGGITTASFAAGAIDAAALATDAAQEICDTTWGRDMSAISRPGGGVRYPLQAIDAGRNKVDTSVSPAVIYQQDDSTQSFTTTLTTNVAALPVTISDPT